MLSAFNAAINHHHPHVAVLLLEQGVPIDSRSDDNRSLLLHIIEHKPLLTDVVLALVQRGADVNERDDDESTVLIQTCRSAVAVEDASDYTAVIKALLKAGATVNDTDQDGRTALHWAMFNCPAAAVKALLEAGAEPDVIDNDGDSPLITLCRGMRDDRHGIARMLLKQGANANRTAHDGHSAIHLAMSSGDTTLGKLLSVKRPQQAPTPSTSKVVKLVTGSGARQSICVLAAKGDLAAIRDAAEAGADINAVDEHGCTGLIRAAGEGQMEAVELLVQLGADAHRTTSNGFTALMAAASANHAEIVTYLASQGADIEHRQEFGVTPLMMAAARWNTKVIKALIHLGADINARDDSDSTPLMAAVQAALVHDDYDRAVEVIDTLLEAGANVSAVNDDGQSALMLVLGVRAPSEVKVPGRTLARLVHQLLRAGAGVDQQDLTGWSALHAAAAYGLVEPARELLVAGANQRLRDINGLSACDLAMDCGHNDIVDLLIGKR
ncbi:MAG: hypothetical protein DHS20C11_19580 [Lysobacteraceae bacterium]|nr:MAG: hypothetical protein DHS20C11_19580 [Xanthomonadaceae bacterium]